MNGTGRIGGGPFHGGRGASKRLRFDSSESGPGCSGGGAGGAGGPGARHDMDIKASISINLRLKSARAWENMN